MSSPQVIHDLEMHPAQERLRELEKKHEVVSIIVGYVRRNFQNTKPPTWLDLRKVAQQLLRSSNVTSSRHIIIRGLSQAVSDIKTWMADHRTWEEAVTIRKMPYIGDRSEILAVQLLSPGILESPAWTRCKLMDVGLQFLSAHESRAAEAIDVFWQGAKLEDAAWRGQYMASPVKPGVLPFEDDLNHLVFTSICEEKPRARESNGGTIPQMATPRSNIAPQLAPSRNCDAIKAWEKEAWVSFDRITETLTRVVADEGVRLLGKRTHQDETVQNEAKRQRIAQDTRISHPDVPISTTETEETDETCKNGNSTRLASMDNGAKRVERYNFLRSNTTSVSRGHDERPVGLSGKLKNTEGQLRDELSRMAQMLNELLKKGDNQVTEKLGRLEMENKSLRDEMALQRSEFEKDIGKLVDINRALHGSNQALQGRVDLQTAVFSKDIKNLKGESNRSRERGDDLAGRLDEQNAKFEEERKKLDGKINSLMARIETIAQTL